MSQASKQDTKRSNLTTFILIKMALHALYSWENISLYQLKNDFFHLYHKCHISSFSLALQIILSRYGFACPCLHAPVLEHNEDDDERKELLFKLIPIPPESHISSFFLALQIILSRYGFASPCAHAPGLGHNENDERKEHFITQIQKKKFFWNLFIFHTSWD